MIFEGITVSAFGLGCCRWRDANIHRKGDCPFEYQQWRAKRIESSQEVGEWHQQNRSICAEVNRTWENMYIEPRQEGTFNSYDDIEREMENLSKRLDQHASEGESLDVDQQILEEMRGVSSKCRRVYEKQLYLDRGKSESELKELGNDAASTAAELKEKSRQHI